MVRPCSTLKDGRRLGQSGRYARLAPAEYIVWADSSCLMPQRGSAERIGRPHQVHPHRLDPEWSRRMNGKAFLLPLARLLMSSLFVWDGIVQLRNPGGTAQYFASVHIPVPNIAVWISILVHLLGGLALLAGFYSRWAAALLALVCLGTAFGVHLPAGDQDNMIHFYKNLVMTGGFLYVIAFGPGGLSLDRGAA
jgi:putative oxidoreductase